MPRGYICYHFRNEKGIELGSPLLVQEIFTYLVFKCLDATDTGRKNHSDAIQVLLLQVEAGIAHRILGCLDGQLRIAVILPYLLAVEMISRVEILHLAGELRLEKGCIEMSNRPGAALTCEGVLPSGLNVVSQGSDGSQACYYYSL